jgi:hypothetical protein
MAVPPNVPLRALRAEAQRALERIAAASSERRDRVCRAEALLAVMPGESLAQAARQAGLRSPSAVAGIVARFNPGGLASLQIAAGRGRKPTYDAAARARIVATAQRPPDRRADGTGTWSLSTLERRLRQDGLPQLGATTIRRVLEDAGSSSQKTRTWCPTGTAQRKRKSGVVTVVDPQTEARSS